MLHRTLFNRLSLSCVAIRLGAGILLGLLPLLTLGAVLPRTARALPDPGVIQSHTSAVQATGGVCIAPDNGSGTVSLPPAPCQYVALTGEMMIIDGLPPGTTIEIDPVLHNYTNVSVTPGGSLGGQVQTFDATLTMYMLGTGDLAGYARTINMPVAVETHTGPRTPGDPIQVFPADLFQLQGSLFGDPDFNLLQIQAGTNFGLPGPGQTTLTQLPSGDFAIDSFFDITYRIDFVGAPGSIVDGLSGTTQDTVRLDAVSSPDTDLAIIKTVAPTTANPGAPITYTIAFFNTGGTIATDVLITDTLPVTVATTAVISTGVAITDTGVSPGYVWRVQNLLPGERGVITITGILSDVLVESTFTNTVHIAAAEVESNVANNAGAAGIRVWVHRVYLPLVLRDY